MKTITVFIVFILGFTSVHADQTPSEKLTPTYAHRINFDLPRLGYEHIKPDAIYIGVECWYLWGIDLLDGFQPILGEAEGRIGYNFFLNISNTITPFVGGGYFTSLWPDEKQKIGFSSLGFRYEHIFGRVFDLGLNLEGMLGHSLNHRRSSWGNPIWGVDVGVPFTWRFTRKKNWDFRLEPFFTGWFGRDSDHFFGGLRAAWGFRF